MEEKTCNWQTKCEEDEGKNTLTCYEGLASGVVRKCPYQLRGTGFCPDYKPVKEK